MDPLRPVRIEDLLAQRDWVRRLARGLVEGSADVDDVEQETWFRALRRPPRTGGSLRGWLSRVTRSVRIDAHRAETKRRVRERTVARAEAQEVGDVVAQAESFRRVVEAAYALEEPQRTVVLLRYFEDLTVPEIARKLVLEEEAVRARLRRALARMRDRLDRESGGDRTVWTGAVAGVAARRRRPVLASAAAAGLAGGFVMAGAKVAAAVAVLAAVAWWAFRDGEADGTRDVAAPGSAAEVGPDGRRVPERRARARTRADEGAAVPAPALADPAAVAAGAAERTPAADAADLVEIRRRVVDLRGAPLAGATVRIVRADSAALLALGAEVVARTDVSGSFEARVPRGKLVARVSVEGFVDAEVPLVEGETELRVRLDGAWALRGTVVARETGEGVAGVTVAAHRAGTDELVGAAVTGATGEFTVTGVPEESLDLHVGEPTGAFHPVLGVVQPPPTLRFAPARVSAVPPRSGEVRVELLPGRSIEGTLVDDAGDPVATPVVLELIGRTAQGGPDYSVRRRIEIADERGAFRVDGLSDREYDLSFVPAAPGTDASDRTRGAVRVPAVAAGTTDLRVVLSAGAPLRLRVVDPDGTPLDGGAIYVHAPGRLPGEHGTVFAAPRLEGRYETAPLDRSKSFDILASGFPGHLQGTRKGLRPGGEEVVVTLQRAGRVTGRVVDEEGRAAGARVPVSARAQGVVDHGPGTGWTGYTDAEGAFVLDTLGDHAFALVAGGGDSGFVPAGAVRDVRPGRADLVLRVRRGVSLTGRLLDASGKPVRTHLLAAHTLEPDGSVAPTTKIAGDDGRFVFRGVRPGRVRISCFLGEGFVDVGEVDAPATDVELVLPER